MLTAALAWYDEQPAMLARCVESLNGVADDIVALAGRWARHPAAAIDNTVLEALAIQDAACPHPTYITIPDDVYPTQAAKRTELMRLACNLPDTRWVLVIDADEAVDRCSGAMRNRLDAITRDVALVGHTDGRHLRRLLRADVNLTVGPTHADYRVGDRWLAGNPPIGVELERAADLSGVLQIRHDRSDRTLERTQAARAYRNRRHADGANE